MEIITHGKLSSSLDVGFTFCNYVSIRSARADWRAHSLCRTTWHNFSPPQTLHTFGAPQTANVTQIPTFRGHPKYTHRYNPLASLSAGLLMKTEKRGFWKPERVTSVQPGGGLSACRQCVAGKLAADAELAAARAEREGAGDSRSCLRGAVDWYCTSGGRGYSLEQFLTILTLLSESQKSLGHRQRGGIGKIYM